jgi:Fur family transcriptional regulator, iron response regulator
VISKSINRNELAGLLRSRGVNITHQRVEIAYALFSRMEHLSADQILGIVNEHHAETSKATVYNTLRLLREKELVREVIIDPSKIFYDPNTMPHHHFFDIVSGQLTDIPASAIQITGLPPLPEGVIAESVEVIIRTRPSP